MLVLFETPAGFALFKVLDEGKLSKVEVIILTIFFVSLFVLLWKWKTSIVVVFFCCFWLALLVLLWSRFSF